MTLTRDFKQTAVERVERDSAFAWRFSMKRPRSFSVANRMWLNVACEVRVVEAA
jgi:hypothetical protein